MRKAGFVLMWLGFLAAAFIATRQADTVSWALYVPAALMGAVGVALLRRTAGGDAAHVETVRSNIATLEGCLSRLVQRLSEMNGLKEKTFVYDIHKRIDAELLADLVDFADAREAMIHGIGLQEYANVMDNFARSERHINRAWSASADGYVDETWNSLQRAEAFMRDADRILQDHLSARPI
jgi:hypothetical protein